MLFNIFFLICFFGSACSLKCHVTNDKCQIEFQFDQPLAGNPKWSQKCLTLIEQNFCRSVAKIDYVTQVTEVHLVGINAWMTKSTVNDSTFTSYQLSIDFQENMNVQIAIIVYCHTKDMCATEIIQSLLPKFNTMKGRSLEIYSALQALLIAPSAQSSDEKGDISCFQSNRTTTARCTAKNARTCTFSEIKFLSYLFAGCTNTTKRELSIGYTQRTISQKLERIDPYSEVYCDRDNCNAPAVYQQALNLSVTFLEGTYVSNAAHRSSSIFGIQLFFLIMPTIACQH